MRCLVIETAMAACSVALIEDGRVVASSHDIVGRGHAERLMSAIANLPAGGRADAVMVDCGPGSFTGVRIGLAAARGLGLGWGVPVSGYSSLALLAATAQALKEADGVIDVAIQAGHGQIFFQTFLTPALIPQHPVESLIPADAAAKSAAPTVVGNGAAQILALRARGGAEQQVELNAVNVTLLPRGATALTAAPIYGRGADAVPMA
jgi:tRNA threonylcarbamoyladenosine biosynthesis protein TsaB